VEYAVCGGLAVAFHGYPRATWDIDLMIRRESLDAAQEAIASLGYTVPGGILPFAIGTSEYREVFRISRADGSELITLDLILVTPILEDVWADCVSMSLPDREIRVVSQQGLATMKRLAGRLRDLADLEELGLLDDDDET